MIIDVSSKNEHYFTPDIFGNMKLPEGERIKFVLRKVSSLLKGDNWTRYSRNPETGKDEITFDAGERLRAHIVRIENPPVLKENGQKDITLDVETLISGKYHALDKLLELLFNKINELDAEKVDTKK